MRQRGSSSSLFTTHLVTLFAALFTVNAMKVQEERLRGLEQLSRFNIYSVNSLADGVGEVELGVEKLCVVDVKVSSVEDRINLEILKRSDKCPNEEDLKNYARGLYISEIGSYKMVLDKENSVESLAYLQPTAAHKVIGPSDSLVFQSHAQRNSNGQGSQFGSGSM